ncbi:MFS transporter [Syntrophomonas palmitatica]|uniref:MFS transporter n=1 Tax=Syntrophomonas palmitatica TaxID=402877 RepID=UPI0006D0DB72|nr:MFS transporter [Syntrophomonas palmitatica]
MSCLNNKLLGPLGLFVIASLFMGLYSGLYDPSFNNYLAQVHNISEVARGGLEFPRELPGFLVVFIFSALAFLPDTRLALLAAGLVGLSLWGQGFLAPGIKSVVFWMFLWSCGTHLFMVLKSSIGLRLADKGSEGRLLGRLGGYESWGALTGMLVVYWGVSKFHLDFSVIFGISGTCALLAALALFFIHPQPIKRPPRYLMFKKKYGLYYLLSMLFGARKQVFLTFGPWVLIKLFGSGVKTFALLGLIGTGLSLFFRPLLGRAIDAWGERVIIAIESLLLFAICLLYALAPRYFGHQTGLLIIMVCFVTDQVLMAVTIARTTFLNRIVDDPGDLGPTISMGLTLDHAVSMSVPFAGGLLWAVCGYQWVFIAAAVIALINLGASFFISRPRTLSGIVG